MPHRTTQLKLPALHIIMALAIISLTLTSCFDFEFESPYEDINGIYLEHVQSYEYGGTKLLFSGNIGYLVSNDSMQIHDFTHVDSIFLLNVYQASYYISDFDIAGAYAFLACGILGLEIVDRNYEQPHIVASLNLDHARKIRVSGEHAYVVTGAYINVVDIVNIADKSNPILVSNISFNGVIIHMEVHSNLLYILLNTNEFHIIDVTDPISPSAVYVLPYNDSLIYRSFTVRDDYIYLSIVADIPGLITYRMQDNNELAITSEICCPGVFRDMYATTSYGLALTGSSYIFLLSLEYPAAPSISETISIDAQPEYGIIKDNYIYVLAPTFTPSLKIIEIKQVDQ
ncbi:hypothetical protein AMJ83_00650 [candidate division WOR_3 bacterium SM23_42]|uniref:LVIVD repeat protein n=1 Tax=candidate division WOR_3 bacterium SM23_42 TaxID=1703779 RepID=A0A0S8FW01_UNCW3|nr:MAG: hypothetical protein AMJ83_00650 [candidate division WOR_3 bacterium SM23_42]